MWRGDVFVKQQDSGHPRSRSKSQQPDLTYKKHTSTKWELHLIYKGWLQNFWNFVPAWKISSFFPKKIMFTHFQRICHLALCTFAISVEAFVFPLQTMICGLVLWHCITAKIKVDLVFYLILANIFELFRKQTNITESTALGYWGCVIPVLITEALITSTMEEA